MHTCDPQSGGVRAPHAQANVMGRHTVDYRDARWRGGSVGLHAHGNMARQVVDDLSAEGSGSKNRRTTLAPTNTTPVCQLLGSANAETMPAGTRAAAAVRTQRPNAAREGKKG